MAIQTLTQIQFLFFSFIFTISFMNLVQFCEPQSPQNIETFYPISPAIPPTPPPTSPPAVLPPTPTPLTPPPLPPPPDTPSKHSASRKQILTAVGVTAATTLVLAAGVFFLCARYNTKRKNQGGGASTPAFAAARGSGGGGRLPPQSQTEFTRFDGNIKGLIVDEDGLDILYWRKLEGNQRKSNGSGPFHKEAFNKGSSKKLYSIPRGKSSSSQTTQIHPQDDQKARLLDSNPTSPTHANFPALPPPPPPPPPVIAGNRPAPSPPPQPVLGKKGPAPPPPPPVSGRKIPAVSLKADALASSSSKPPPVPRRTPGGDVTEVSAIEEDESAGKNEQVKLKPLHWEKVNVNPHHSMVWDKIDRGSFQCNVDMMEALFGYVATNRKSPPESSGSGHTNQNLSPAAKIFILDSRRSQNAAIVIRTLGVTRKELIQGLQEGKDLNAETLEKLSKITPTREEKIKIIGFDGDVGRLADAESFLYHLLKAVPSAFNRVNAMLFRFTYDSEVDQLKDAFKTLDSACTQLRSSRVFTKLLEAILKAGNRLNAGTTRGNAQAFNLSALLKLSDYKSSDGKTTLLHFVVHEVVRNEGRRCVLIRNNSQRSSGSGSSSSSNPKPDDPQSKEEQEREFLRLGLPVVGGLGSELQNVKKAATVDYDSISRSSSSMAARISETRQLVLKCGADGAGDFVKEMKEFLRGAEEDIKDVKEEQTKVMECVKRTTEYYQAGAFKDKHPLQLFVIVNNFVSIVDQACIEIARSLQQRKANTNISASSPSSLSTPDVLRTRVTFPRLPDNFLSEKSNASDSDDDRRQE